MTALTCHIPGSCLVSSSEAGHVFGRLALAGSAPAEIEGDSLAEMHAANDGSAMSNPDAAFEPYRRRLTGLAYRMLGSMADAEDAVQETYVRWHETDRDRVSNPRAFLMTTTTRICLDLLKSARARREE